jgi:proline racemase
MAPLRAVASIIRSKNAGPYRITFDILLPDHDSFRRAVEARVVTRESVAHAFGIEMRPGRVDELVRAGLALREAINQRIPVRHPTLGHIRSVDLVTLYGPPLADGATYKNIHVFANGSSDRSPGGTGTSHVMALLFARGEVREDDVVVAEGISGSLFEGRILGRARVGEFDAIVPEISGTAHLTGFHQFVIDPDDPIASGFLLG